MTYGWEDSEWTACHDENRAVPLLGFTAVSIGRVSSLGRPAISWRAPLWRGWAVPWHPAFRDGQIAPEESGQMASGSGRYRQFSEPQTCRVVYLRESHRTRGRTGPRKKGSR